MPTLPLSLTTNEALVFVFSTRNAVVALVAPEPLIPSLALKSDVVPKDKLASLMYL